jgi:NMD protein affecting ribosome stability and mRNA decay
MDMREFCARCGKTGKLIDSLCKDCYLEKNKVAYANKENLITCSICGKWSSKSKWTDLETAVSNIVKCRGKIQKMILGVDSKFITVTVKTKIDGKMIDCVLDKKIKIRKISCPDCLRQRGGYYESIVQMRGKWEKHMGKLKQDQISRIEETKEGPNILFVLKKDARRFVESLGSNNTKYTYKLIGERNGKRIYRQTVLVRIDD